MSLAARPLVQRLLETAKATPHATGIVCGPRRTTYGELAGLVQRFAGALRSMGLGDGERVAIVLPVGAEAAAACYGSWLAGCIAVPLNRQASQRELAAWLADADVRALVHDEGCLAVIEAAEAMVHAPVRICVGRDGGASGDCRGAQDWSGLLAASRAPADTALRSTAASIMYTSGTTGRPKGVVLSHANFAANADAIIRYLQLTPEDCTVSVLPFQYSYGASVLHTHLAVGACLVVEPNFVFPQAALAAAVRERATGFSGVATTYALLLPHLVETGVALPTLRYLTHAGGIMTRSLLARVLEALPGVRVFTMYGQTEATARLAWMPPGRLADKQGAAGRAIEGVSLQVRDPAGAVLPARSEGEVWATGEGIMQGYWNDPLATAAVLRQGWLRTGDIGWLDEEGFLFLVGRRVDIIKTGAHRVHPAEVEQALCELPGVGEAAVVGVEDVVLGQAVKAFIVRTLDHAPDAMAVRAHCRRLLSTYKVPRDVEFVDALPRTSSGKVRRAALATVPSAGSAS